MKAAGKGVGFSLSKVECVGLNVFNISELLV